MESRKLKKRPPLTARHRENRLRWAHERMAWTEQWKKVIWSDEKKFNFDGPDGYQHYWHDLRKEDKYLSRRQQGGGGVMVWIGFGAGGKCDLVFFDGNVNAGKYQLAMETHLLPFWNTRTENSVVYQRDNASIHTARTTKQFFVDHNIPVMEWPANSPDLNPAENVWGMLVRKIYADGVQYNNTKDLKNAILAAWRSLSMELLVELTNKMPERIFSVIQHNGGNTKY